MSQGYRTIPGKETQLAAFRRRACRIDERGSNRYLRRTFTGYTMSQQKKYNIRCPKCQQDLSVELYEAINVQTSPELKKSLMANQMNTVTCEQCALTFRVDKPLLYHDPARGFMIYQIPMGEESVEKGELEFTESLGRLTTLIPKDIRAPNVSLVFSRTELVERIFLRDAGLNERIIEYIKYMIYIRNGGKIHPAKKALLFDAEDSTPKALCFVVQDVESKKLESVLQYDRKTYTALCEMFDKDDQTPTLLELFPGPYISARRLILKESSEPKSPEQKPPAPPKPQK